MKAFIGIPNVEEIEREEQETKHFARGLNFYKLFWIFFVGSFLGVIVETVWCLMTRLHLESRVSTLYGPFNHVYGFGALAMALGLHWAKATRSGHIMLGGFLIGSIVEYISSFVQQVMFGSASWDYSVLPFNLFGRISLLYSLFWGILAVLWVRVLYPYFSCLILHIPDKIGKALTWILLVFMIFNTAMTIMAVDRWTQRMDDTASPAPVWEYFDRHYPDNEMKRLFPNMK
ncbi:MAG: putative ABC transporter permease, partial [Oscillospiraceae bacterium]